MALTMTRTRTQTALTKLAEAAAGVHGELAVLEVLFEALPDAAPALMTRRETVLANRHALHLTLRQFDPELDPEEIGVSSKWLATYAPGSRRRAFASYLDAIRVRVESARAFQSAWIRVRHLCRP